MDLQGLLSQYAGYGQPNEEDKKAALNMGLLQAGLGILMGAQPTRGYKPPLGPALGMGGMMGLQGYNQALQQGPHDRLKSMQAAGQMVDLEDKLKQREMLRGLQGKFTDPAAGLLAAAGDYKGAVSRQYPEQKYSIQKDETGKYMYLPDRPGAGAPVPAGIGAYNEALDPRVRDAKFEDAMKLENALDPLKIRRALASRAQVTVQNIAENKYAGKVGEASGEADLKSYDSAVSARDNVEKLNSLVKHLKTSDAITGLGAEVMLNAKRVQTLLTNDAKAGKTVADTQVLDAMLGQDVFPMIQSLGIGARGLDTPAEREYLRKVMTGTIEMDKQALVKLAEIRRDIAKRAVDRWNERVDSGELDRYFQASMRPKQKLPVPKIDSELTSDQIGGGGWSIVEPGK